jgi:cullin 1
MLKNFKLLEIRSTPQPEGAAASGKMTPSGIQLRDDTVIGVNESFVSPLNRIVFPTPVLEEVYKKGTYQPTTHIHFLEITVIELTCHAYIEVVQEDRSIAIEAAIVRIMKSRKKLEHNALIQEVLITLR